MTRESLLEQQYQQQAQSITQPQQSQSQSQSQSQQHQHQHSRSDTIYSMDSFVAELPEIPERGNLPESDRFEYISPSSSSAVSIESRKISGKIDKEQELRFAKNNLASRSYSTDTDDFVKSYPKEQESVSVERIANNAVTHEDAIIPVHSFFNQPYFQVDTDDMVEGGSIVFKTSSDVPHAQLTQSTSSQQNLPKFNFARDRLPSFESVGSSGSLVWKLPSKGSSKPPTPASPSAPKILPYHERRKLLQQRQIQQHQRPQVSKTENSVSKSDQLLHSSLQNSTFNYKELPESSLLNQPHQMTHQPLLYAGTFVQPPSSVPVNLNFQEVVQHSQLLQSQSVVDIRQQPMRPVGNQVERLPSGNMNSTIGNTRTFLKTGSLSSFSSNAHSRPPIQPTQQHFASSSISGSAGGCAQTSSSFDSSDDHGFGNHISGLSMNHTLQPPPPPPPPPPLKAAHIRKDSTGSVSSLGSVERSSREDNDTEKQYSATSFLHRLNPWPTKESLKPAPGIYSSSQMQQAFHENKRVANFPIQVSQRNNLLTSGNMHGTGIHHGAHSLGKDGRSQGEKHQKCIPSNSTSNLGRIRPDFSTQNIERLFSTSSSRPNPKSNHNKIRSGREIGKAEHSVLASSSSDETENDEGSFHASTGSFVRFNETSKLLPPTGISSNEYYDRKYIDYGDRPHRNRRHKNNRRIANEAEILTSEQIDAEDKSRRRNRKRAKRHRRKKKRNVPSGDSSHSSSASSASVSSHNYQQRMQTRALLKQDRQQLIKQWKAEAAAEEAANQKLKEENMIHRRCCRLVGIEASKLTNFLSNFFSWVEAFFANFPIMIGAVAYAFANLGQDWFKAVQERTVACQPVHFHSAQCTFPEFPGCFYCDTSSVAYKLSLNLHLCCSAFAGLLAFTFLSKLVIARNIFLDELSNPISIAPAGLICMTLSVAFAGRGVFGMWIVLISSFVHLCLVLWFVYMALAYRLLPDPSWFPNTVGIGICAVKTWLYYPVAGKLLMTVSLSLNVFFFPISIFRVGFNKKISATVGWMLMSAPNVSLYALTIMAQPSFEEEEPDINNYQKVHRMLYLPYMHFLFGLCITGMLASVNSLRVRWNDFRNVRFSAAHASFCFPIVSHASAIQAYRAAIISFSDFPTDGLFRISLYCYWLTILIAGTAVTAVVSIWFFLKLPSWTHVDIKDELEPPPPNETAMQLTDTISAGETLLQPYVSPAVLQVNETGALVLVRDVDGQRYTRSRRVSAIGFEPLLSTEGMEIEREVLFDWIGKNPHRRRHRTLSVPGIDFNYESSSGLSHSAVYGMDETSVHWIQRPRSNTPPSSRKTSHYTDLP